MAGRMELSVRRQTGRHPQGTQPPYDGSAHHYTTTPHLRVALPLHRSNHSDWLAINHLESAGRSLTPKQLLTTPLALETNLQPRVPTD